MVGFSFGSSVEVQRLHALAIDLIGTNEGNRPDAVYAFCAFCLYQGFEREQAAPV